MIGHLLGAAGGVEAIVTVKAIKEGLVHPTRNLEDPAIDPSWDVPTQAAERKIRYALSNSFGFGGHNAATVFGAFNE
jgi:3-oxoacyl-[acyl-carrier-protein] synthase II